MSWLLKLYPRGWRQRYGGEVQALVASEEPSLRLYLDLLLGAVDARLNPQWNPAPSSLKGHSEMNAIKRLAHTADFTLTDHGKSAFIMIAASALFVSVGVAIDKIVGEGLLSKSLIYAAFPMAMVLSSRGTYLRAYSRPVIWALLTASLVGIFLSMLAVTYVTDVM